MKTRRFRISGLPLLVLLIPMIAEGQALPAAEALFKKGIAEMEAGQYDTACPTLAESHKLEARPGTLFALAQCHDKAGKIATAAVLYDDYLRAFEGLNQAWKLRHLERSKVAKQQREILTPQIPELTLVLPKGAPAEVRVMRDDVELSAASLGVGLPVDPGEHTITVEVSGWPSKAQKVALEKGEKKTVQLVVDPPKATARSAGPRARGASVGQNGVPALGADPAGARSSSKSNAIALNSIAIHMAPSPGKEGDTGGGRTVGIVLAGSLGAAGFVAGGVAGGLTLEKKAIVDDRCDGLRCDHEGMVEVNTGRTLSIVSTVGFGVGIAGAVTATILWLAGPSGKKTEQGKPKVQVGLLGIHGPGTTLGVRGAF